MRQDPTRYELVSRRAMLKAAAGLGLAVVLPTACGNGDTQVFSGALTDAPTAESAAARTLPTTAPVEVVTVVPPHATSETLDPTAVPEVPATAEPADPTAIPEAQAVAPTAVAGPVAEAPTATPPISSAAVLGDMVISFTYTRGAVGKVERPYVAVWLENAAGELAETVALWYEQGRRGARWLDHLNRWYPVDQDRILAVGIDDSVTISSATREPGSYAVAWDGNIDGVPAAAGLYYVCIETAREEGPNSLIRQSFDLAGSLSPSALPATGEISAASVRIDA